jgi:hypothetical protein
MKQPLARAGVQYRLFLLLVLPLILPDSIHDPPGSLSSHAEHISSSTYPHAAQYREIVLLGFRGAFLFSLTLPCQFTRSSPTVPLRATIIPSNTQGACLFVSVLFISFYNSSYSPPQPHASSSRQYIVGLYPTCILVTPSLSFYLLILGSSYNLPSHHGSSSRQQASLKYPM